MFLRNIYIYERPYSALGDTPCHSRSFGICMIIEVQGILSRYFCVQRIPSHSLRDSRLQFLEVFSFQKPVKLDLENLLSAPHLRSVLLNCLEGVHLPKADQPIHIASPLLYVDLDHDCALRFNAKVEAGLKSVGFDCRSRVLSIGDSILFNPLADNGFFADRAITAAIETFEGAEDSPTLKSYIEVLEASHIWNLKGIRHCALVSINRLASQWG